MYFYGGPGPFLFWKYLNGRAYSLYLKCLNHNKIQVSPTDPASVMVAQIGQLYLSENHWPERGGRQKLLLKHAFIPRNSLKSMKHPEQ